MCVLFSPCKIIIDSTKILHTFLRVSYPFPTAAHFLQLPALRHQKAWVPKTGRDWLWIQLGLRKHRQRWEKISSSDLSFQGSGSRLLLSALIIAANFWFFQSPVVVFQANESRSWKSLLCLENWRILPQDGSSPTWPLLTTFRQPGPGTCLMMETFVAISAGAAGTVFIPSADMQIVVGGAKAGDAIDSPPCNR